MCQWGIWFIYNITFSERILFFRENRLSTFLGTPTGPGLSAPLAAHVGVASPQSLCLSSRHANRARIFRAGGRPCWRWPPRKVFVLRHATPTPAPFSSARGSPYWRWPPRTAFVLRLVTPTPVRFPRRADAHVGVGLPAKPLSFATPRQQGPYFPRRRSSMLASASRQSLCPSSRHANRARIFRAGGCPCWRRPPRKAFVLRHATPTGRALHGPGLRAGGFYILICTKKYAVFN